MYKIRGKVKETEKTLFFNCIFCHTERTFPVQSLSCCREGEGVGRRNVTDVCKALLSSMARLSQPFAWVSSRNRCFGSSWLQGPLVGPGCTAAELSEAPPSCASICRITAFCRDRALCLSRVAPPVWQGGQVPAGAQLVRTRELFPEQSALHLSQMFCAVAFSATSISEQPLCPCYACFCERFRNSALLCAFMWLPPNQ